MKENEEKRNQYWKEKLTSEEYHILREKGTEPAFSSELLDSKEIGMYICKGCGAELFSSDSKFDSGTGWPSFTAPLNRSSIHEESDESHGMSRIEAICSRCGGHLGHVFPDGPEPTGLRYCINGEALHFKEE